MAGDAQLPTRMAAHDVANFAQRRFRLFAQLVAVETEIKAVDVGVTGLGERAFKPALPADWSVAGVFDLYDFQRVAIGAACSGSDAKSKRQGEGIVFVVEKNKLGPIPIEVAAASGIDGRQINLLAVYQHRIGNN